MCTCYICTEFILPSYHVSGVLHASFTWDLAFEAHLCPELEGADSRTRNRRLRIAHVIIRINTRPGVSYADRIASIENHLLILSHLQSITLETRTIGEDEEDTEWAGRLGVSRERGILYQRTCEQSWKMTLEAVKNPTFRAEQQNVVSPMWISDRFDDDDCSRWCVTVSRPSTIPRLATELIMFSHRLGNQRFDSDKFEEFKVQRAELRKKAKELWAQCDEEARKRVEDAANARAPIVRDERTNAVIPNGRPDAESAAASATAT